MQTLMPPNVNGIFKTVQGNQLLVKVMFYPYRKYYKIRHFTYFIFFIYPFNHYENHLMNLESHQNFMTILKGFR
jgi:hypothetical protein